MDSMTPLPWSADLVLRTMWAFLPAMMANQMPLLTRDIPFLDVPVDAGMTWRDGKRLLGDHKTLRGLFLGVLGGAVTALAQASVPVPHRYVVVQGVHPLLVGATLGAGALIGDLIESFVKRRKGVPPGEDWFPFDQLDAAFGALVAIWLLA
ncbi:MAG: CDP-archaeol synthase, partial [Methanopyri archaeon]|nr:CDP-archaeol synthase [Methanopyri archaeon]